MSKQKTIHKTEIDNICITSGNESQSNIAVSPVITAFVVANMVAFSTMGGVSGRTSPTSRCLTETLNVTAIEYPSLDVGTFSNGDEIEGIIPQARIENGNTLIYKEASETIAQNEKSELRRENAMLKNRLLNSLPIHAVMYMVGSSFAFAVSSTLLFVRFILNTYIIDPYYLICAAIISMGLFFTAFVSLKDWKDNLLNERFG